MSMFILGVFSWRRRPACSLLAACMQGVDAGVRPRNAGRRRPAHGVDAGNCARVFQWRRLHLKRNAACMQPACRLHAGCCNLQPPAYDRMQAACSLHAACMQPACISSVATWHYTAPLIRRRLTNTHSIINYCFRKSKSLMHIWTFHVS